MLRLAYLYQELISPADPEATRQWWERAADAGHSDAMHNLGVLHH
ncbi:MAG: hypothetical protein QOG79_1538, partial [Mycobacterium sp.]|nr:hypothetical protein [Mycobacterium sp.]